MFQSCLICTDFTDGLHRLTDAVTDLAQFGLKQIVFFHSVPLWEEGEVPRIDEEKIQAAKDRFQKSLKNSPPGIEVKAEVLSGKPLDTIPKVLKNHPVDVILTGTPIKSLLQEQFFGSTSAGLAKLTSQPLNIIRPELISTCTTEELALRCRNMWRYLLIPYNDSESARYLIQQIKHYAQNRPENSLTQCMLLSVVDDCITRGVVVEDRIKQAQTSLASVKAELESLNLKVNMEVRKGNPLQETLAAAMDFDITAIAIATDYRNNLLQWTVRSYANDMMRSSWFPILLFSPKK